MIRLEGGKLVTFWHPMKVNVNHKCMRSRQDPLLKLVIFYKCFRRITPLQGHDKTPLNLDGA